MTDPNAVILRDVLNTEPMTYAWERPLVLALFENRRYASGDHDIFHSLRVKRLAYRLADAHPADKEVLCAAAYLHDIASDSDRYNHIPLAMQRAEQVLPAIGFPQAKLSRLLECIALHEDYNWAQDPERASLAPEVQVFQDADRLDAIGAIGVARSFSFSAVHHVPMWLPSVGPDSAFDPQVLSRTTINHFQEKLLRLADIFNTDLARAIGTARTAYLRQFMERFIQEWNAEDLADSAAGVIGADMQ